MMSLVGYIVLYLLSSPLIAVVFLVHYGVPCSLITVSLVHYSVP